jgi:hypothetical protein
MVYTNPIFPILNDLNSYINILDYLASYDENFKNYIEFLFNINNKEFSISDENEIFDVYIELYIIKYAIQNNQEIELNIKHELNNLIEEITNKYKKNTIEFFNNVNYNFIKKKICHLLLRQETNDFKDFYILLKSLYYDDKDIFRHFKGFEIKTCIK